MKRLRGMICEARGEWKEADQIYREIFKSEPTDSVCEEERGREGWREEGGRREKGEEEERQSLRDISCESVYTLQVCRMCC